MDRPLFSAERFSAERAATMTADTTASSTEGSRILLVEDDAPLAALISDYLGQHGFQVEIESRGDMAPRRIVERRPDLVILDVMLPGTNGMDICRQVRPHFANPILMLTARADDFDQVVGLELGADDYVKKPVQPRVLLARVRALLRRTEALASSDPDEPVELAFGALQVSRASRRVVLDNVPVELTTAQFELLWLMARNAGKILSRETLFSSLRGTDYDGLDRSIDIAMSRLRQKLGDSGNPPARIKTVRGQGYLFVADAW
jgi:DNA-binding response OmpR family regulator